MRIGIVGCGTVAQIMHIPYVVELPETELHALVDPALERAATLASRYNVPHTFETTEDLLAEVGDELDAVIVLTPAHSHADVVVETLEAGLHTLVEKPLSVSVADADRMVRAAENSSATAMVAYMKRYDPAYERAQDAVSDLEEVDLITAYDVDPDHFRIIEEVYDLVPGEVSESFIEASNRNRRADSAAAIGADEDGDGGDGSGDGVGGDGGELVDDYHWHLEHACHDVNALRGLFGAVERIDHVDVFAAGRYVTAHLVYEGGHRCVLDSGLSERKWFEEFIRVDAPDRVITVDFSNPFIKNTPTELQVKHGREQLTEETHTPSYEESFKRELEYFTRCVRGDDEVRTTFAEAREDVRLIADLFRHYRGVETVGTYSDGKSD